MDPEAVRQFDDFWREIRRAEEFIRQYGHTGWEPRYQERWHEPLEQAYAAIRPHLAPVVYPRMIITPVEFPNLNPYEAETAHQALMYFLNPPENLFGHLRALDSREYLQIKRDAHAELDRLQSPRPGTVPPKSRRRGPAKRSRVNSRQANDARTLKGFLIEYHLSPERNSAREPPTQKQIGKQLNWAQYRVSRAIKAVFGDDGMRAYLQLFKVGRLDGFLKHFDDGTSDVEAFVEE
jgi:hypothetical protein